MNANRRAIVRSKSGYMILKSLSCRYHRNSFSSRRRVLKGDIETAEKVETSVATATGTEQVKKIINIASLRKMTIAELHGYAKEAAIEGYTGLKKQDLIFRERVRFSGINR